MICRRRPRIPSDPLVSISGVASFGKLSFSPTGRVNKLYEVVNNLSHHAGAHALRVGANFLYNDTNIAFPRADRGRYTFSSLANFLAGTYANMGFTQNFGITERAQTNPNVGLYVQDEWKATSRLTLNAGLRYDLQYLETISTDTNNFSPRLGFAWSPFEARKTIVRGGAGIFFDRVPLRALANALMAANNTTDLNQLQQTSITLAPTQSGAPVFPDILDAALPSAALVSLSTMDRNMKNAFSQQANLEVERQIGERATVSVGFQHLRGLHLIANINQNVPTCAAAGNNNGCRPNPNYANNSEYSSEAESNYNALHIAFLQRPVRWGSFRVSYTYSKSLNNVGEFFFSGPINHYNIWDDYGRSDNDQRHRLVLQGAVHTSNAAASTLRGRLTKGWELGWMFQYYSALPFNITTGGNTIQGTSARPTVNGAYISRNSGEGYNFSNLSARLSRSFQLSDGIRLQGIVEAFNALNHVNGVTNNGVFGSGAYPTNPAPSFGQMTSAGEARSLQLALRLQF